ncbi:MAG: UDP-3-O-acyl-N-acetylglucosamine deacetylase [Candidatus Omnitrophica bacterium]|nr:UDP-3-O-acyl-N-acetylglucosamine deacetylase [Candidatus Omnitrophota bacterium]
MENQRTIKSKVFFEGIGLHTGKNSKVEVLAAAPNTGIVFIRKDVASAPAIKADFYSVLDPEKFPRRTSVGHDGVYVHTIEHFMAALHLLKIDNLQVNIWGEEIPGLDGSAKLFVDKIREAGIAELEAPKQYLVIKEPIFIEEGSSSIAIFPYPKLRISYALKYNNPLIGAGFIDLELCGDLKPEEDFYQARTFCLEQEVRSLMDMGLGKGANYENTLVVSKDGILKNKLRFSDEFVKHKVLDLIGDLYVAGPFRGYVIAIRSGHSLNVKLLQKLRRYKERLTTSGVESTTSFVPTTGEVSAAEILRILPHRYPFLLVDKIVELDKGKRAVGIKNVTFNEQFFQGHFPGRPVMPGVLIIEAMAQVGGVMMLACEEHSGKMAFFMAANEVKFRNNVIPGDQLVIEVVAGKIKSKTGVVYTKAFVDNKLVAEAELMFALVTS